MSNAISARFYSTCARCEKPISIGDAIVPDPLDGASATWVHERCPVRDLEHKNPVCTDCWLEKPCPCDDEGAGVEL